MISPQIPFFKNRSPLFRLTAFRFFVLLPFFFAAAVLFPLALYLFELFDDLVEVVIFIGSNFIMLSSLLIWSLYQMRHADQKLIKAQAALRESHRRLTQITDSIPGVVYRFRQYKNGEQVFEFMSRGAEEMFGYSNLQIQENFDLIWKLVLPEEISRLSESIQESLSNRSDWFHEFRIKKTNGDVSWIRGQSTPEPSLEDGSAVWNGIFLDITEEKKNREAVRSSREYLDRIINSVADPIFVKDRKHRWVLLNDAMCSFIGHSREKLLEKSDYDFFPKEEADIFLEKDEDVFRSGKENLNEESFTDAKGSKKLIMTKKTLYTDPQGREFIVGVIRDITQHKRLEESLRSNILEIESRNQELKNFAYVVSHDLKAPTYAVSALADWLWTDYVSQLDAKGKEHVELIRKKIEEIRCLIDGILKYSMLDQLQEEMSIVDFNILIKETLQLILIPPSIRVEVAENLPAVQCGKTRMTEVFQNLIENAVKYMDKPSGLIQISCQDRGAEWEFCVRDNGPGIDERNREKVFHLFRAFGGKPRHESSGIGLAIVRKGVEHHGGRVWVESELGKGSSFLLTLPKKQPSAAPSV